MKNNISSEKFMRRAIQIAHYGAGKVSPNPLVGSVIVFNNTIIGEGFHRQCGGAHAEVNAISSVENNKLLSDSSIYVTLEPCSHHGLTPPCADLIIESKIPRVYIGCIDPYSEVSGSGINKLKKAGVEVSVGLCEEECRWMNRRFLNAIQKQRPYIILKWAESLDGFIGLDKDSLENSSWITHDMCRYYVHKMRSEEDAILIGTNTALVDNPSLNIRYWSGNNPLRIVLDRNNRLPKTLRIFDESQPTLVSRHGSLNELLSDLNLRNIRSLIVEGGAQVLNSFIEQNLWDEAHRFIGNVSLGSGVRAPRDFYNIKSNELIDNKSFGDTRLYVFKNNSN